MPDLDLKPVMIVVPDGFADGETPLTAGIGGDFFGLASTDVCPLGGLPVTGLPDALPRPDEIGSDALPHPKAQDLSTMLPRGNAVTGICAGMLPPARAGLFSGRAHRSNGLGLLRYRLPEYAETAHYRDQPQAVAADGVISAPITFATEALRGNREGEFPSLASAEIRP